MRVVLLLSAGCLLQDEDFDRDGWTAEAGDCDDFDPSRAPDLPEIVFDGVDQDCDGVDPLAVVSGTSHRCDLIDGSVSCDGDNSHGQLEAPVGPRPFVAIAAGDFHTCALDAEGWVVCWGDNTFGQSDAPHERFVAIDADANWSLGVSAEDELAWCWGLCRAPRP